MTHTRLALSPHDGDRHALGCKVRRAYTLVEIAVVVALIVVIGALAIPAIMGTFVDARLSGSGDLIRARMADARSMAMEQGRPFRFGFLPGTGKFQVAADDSPLW